MAFLGEILILLRHQGTVFLSAARSKGWVLLGAALSQCCWSRNGQQGLTGGTAAEPSCCSCCLGGKLSPALTPRVSVEPVGASRADKVTQHYLSLPWSLQAEEMVTELSMAEYFSPTNSWTYTGSSVWNQAYFGSLF